MNGERYRTLFDFSPASLWELDLSAVKASLQSMARDAGDIAPDGPAAAEGIVAGLRVIDVNESTLRLLEAPARSDVCANPLAWFPPESRAALRAALDRLLAEPCPADFPLRCLTRTGRSIEAIARLCVPPASAARWETAFLSLRDVTRLADADQLAYVGEMAPGIVHEITNPNQAITLCAGILQNAWSDVQAALDGHAAAVGDFAVAGDAYSQQRDTLSGCISSIAEGARRIQSTVDTLRQFSPIAAEEAAPTDLNAVVRATLLLAGPMLRRCAVAAVVEPAADLPPVIGRQRRLRQLALDLVKNACQALKGTGRGLAVRTRGEDGDVVLEVEDQGEGMEEETLRRAREPFFTTRSGALGLGLFSVDGIVREHGGKLDIASAPGKGTRVTVRLPASGTWKGR